MSLFPKWQKAMELKAAPLKKLLAMLIATGVMTCASVAPVMAATTVADDATVNVGKKAEVAVEEQAKVNVKKNAKVNVEEGAELTVKNGAKVTFSKDAGVGFDNGAKVKLGNKAGVNLADGATLSVAQGSNVSVAENITMGKGANVAVWNGVSGQTISGDIAVGPNAYAWNGEYTYKDKYARIGSKEYFLDFGQGGVVGAESVLGFPYKYKVANGSKIAGSIAIGKNTLARTGSVMLGDHSYTGKLGDIEINPENPMTYNDGIYSTTLGAGAYNSGSLAAVTGALSIASGKDTKNTGATIYGSMNSIESATSNSIYSGVASSVLGFANRTQNANAALIWGTGNEVTNSIENIDIETDWNKLSVTDAQKQAIKAMQSSKYAGGSVMAIGGGNKADYAKYSQLTGVQNKVTGTEAKPAKYDFVNGYQNTVSNASDVTVIGIKNAVTADGNKVIGDNHNVSGNDNVIFGSADKVTETTVNNAVVLGHNAKVTGEGGVALGAGSVADRAAEVVGYDPATGAEYVIPEDDAASYVWKATKGAVSVGINGTLTRQITNVAAGSEDTDAVNVAQLKRAMENVNINFVAGEGIVIETVKGNDGTTYKISTNIIGSETDTDTTTVTSSASGDAGTIDGDTEIANNNIQTGDPVKIETVTKPTNFAADEGDALAISPSETLGIKGDKNITTKADGKNIQVTLNQDLDVNSVAANTVTTGQTVMDKDGLKVGDNVSVTATAVTAGKTSISDEGVKVGDNTYISDKGLNANGQQITNVADGKVEKDSKDAINGGQLHQAKADINNRIDGVENQVVSNTNRINQLGNRVNKVGAGAAALAALHPMDFDPDDKLTFSAGYGNYGGENAAAIGAYYRPDEKVMFSVAGTVGNGENMVNAGVSFALDRTNHVSNSRTALAREVIDLRGQLAVMGAKMAKMEKAFGMLDETKTKLFPDVPANHWAYEYIAKLAGNGYIEGYPDGNFGGDRLMTRYEFAAMLYRAIENGAALEEKIIKEFEPELGRIRVDRISGEDGDRDKIERVRVNDTKGERDHYGNKLAK